MTSYTAINGQNENALLNMWEGEHFKDLFNNNSILKFDSLSLHHALATIDLEIHTEHKRPTQQDNKKKNGPKADRQWPDMQALQTWIQLAWSWYKYIDRVQLKYPSRKLQVTHTLRFFI